MSSEKRNPGKPHEEEVKDKFTTWNKAKISFFDNLKKKLGIILNRPV